MTTITLNTTPLQEAMLKQYMETHSNFQELFTEILLKEIDLDYISPEEEKRLLARIANPGKRYTIEEVAGENWRDGLELIEDGWE